MGMGNGNDYHQSGIGFFVHKGIRSAVKRVRFIRDTMSYTILRGRCDIISQNVHAQTEDKSYDTKDSFFTWNYSVYSINSRNTT
jgi:hypothetical protein